MGVALLARALGHRVSGSDANVYPPMSTQLEAAGIQLMTGYAPEHLQPAPDYVWWERNVPRNPAVEHMLDKGLPYSSGPQWLAEHVLQGRWVLAVAGTWQNQHRQPVDLDSGRGWAVAGFSDWGVPENFGISARLGKAPYFVVEADRIRYRFLRQAVQIRSLPATNADTE